MFKSDAAVSGCHFKDIAATIVLSLNESRMASKTPSESGDEVTEDEEIARILRWAATM